MKLTTRVLYATRIMIDIAQQDGARTPLKYTAERQQISEKYAEQIIAELRAAGLVKSVRGMRGGYLLGRPAKEISMGDIVRVIDDPYLPSEDPRDEVVGKAFERVQAAMWEILDKVSLAKAAKRKK
jgi:Rrf2 family cysteine metabolism transcriptional repressor